MSDLAYRIGLAGILAALAVLVLVLVLVAIR